MTPRLTQGSQLGPYRIEGLLGKGGMGQVFRARDPRLGRSVAMRTRHRITGEMVGTPQYMAPELWAGTTHGRRTGNIFAYRWFDPSGRSEADLWVLPLFGDRKPFPVVESHSNKQNPTFSPDRKWLAYESDESGKWEVYVVGFPQGEGKWRVSTGVGQQPRWRRDGRELFFLATTVVVTHPPEQLRSSPIGRH